MESNPPLEAMSYKTFCKAHQISLSFLYELLKIGEGPATISVGKRRKLITAESAAAWRKRHEQVAA